MVKQRKAPGNLTAMRAVPPRAAPYDGGVSSMRRNWTCLPALPLVMEA